MVVCASATLERFVALDGAYARVARTLVPRITSAQRSALTSNFFRQLSLRINLDRFQPKRDYRTLYYRCRHDMEERIWEDVWCRWFYCDYIGLGQGTCCRSESRRQMWGELLADGRFIPPLGIFGCSHGDIVVLHIQFTSHSSVCGVLLKRHNFFVFLPPLRRQRQAIFRSFFGPSESSFPAGVFLFGSHCAVIWTPLRYIVDFCSYPPPR